MSKFPGLPEYWYFERPKQNDPRYDRVFDAFNDLANASRLNFRGMYHFYGYIKTSSNSRFYGFDDPKNYAAKSTQISVETFLDYIDGKLTENNTEVTNLFKFC